MANFEIASPEDIWADSKAFEYLQNAADGFGSALSVQNTLNNFSQNRDLLIIVKICDETIGAIHLTFTQQETGKVMTSVLLGGDNFSEWAAELSAFYYETAYKNGCSEFMLMGRRGFKRYFPELREVATVFKVSLI